MGAARAALLIGVSSVGLARWGAPDRTAVVLRAIERRGAAYRSSYSPCVLLWCNSLPESGLKEDGICEGPLSMLLVPRVRSEG